MKIFGYYAKVLSIICIFTIICLVLHTFICLDINSLKINIHNITRNYLTLKIMYPVLYILLGINIYMYSTRLDSSKNILIVIALYLIILLLSILSSLLFLRFANFIFAFWLSVLCTVLDIILSYFYLKSSICNFHIFILAYLSFIQFFFYFSSM